MVLKKVIIRFYSKKSKNGIHSRVEKAEKLLRLTEMSISEIAFEMGYNDPQYFDRIFKKK